MLYIDELIQHVIQDLAMDGSLGATPDYVRDFITRTIPTLPSSSTSTPNIDDAFLTYFWKVLIAVPSVEVILLDSPVNVNPERGQMGLVKQPELPKKAKPSNPFPKKSGRKRKNPTEDDIAAATALKASLVASRDEAEVEPVEFEAPLRVLKSDDGSSDRIAKHDLPGLRAKYGDLVHIRVDAEERYHALTGTYGHISSMSVIALRLLQVVGHSREKGVTGQELTQLLDVDPKSMHHYVKVLLRLKLVEKVPVQQGGTRTNRVCLIRYLSKNEDYRAWNPSHSNAIVDVSVQPAIYSRGGDDQTNDQIVPRSSLQFGPLSYPQMTAGVLLKQRLLMLLDSGLKNNLLRNKGLLHALGFHGEVTNQERRLWRRHLNNLIREGVVEQLTLQVGTGSRMAKVDCLRLAKYNPNISAKDQATEVLQVSAVDDANSDEDADELEDDGDEVDLPPFNAMIQVPATKTIEYSVIDTIVRTPENLASPGLTLAALSESTGRLANRITEFFVNKTEQCHPFPHLSDKSIAVISETQGRQRYLRVVKIETYYRYCEAHGTVIDRERHPLPDPSAGHFADLSHRKFYSTADEYNRYISSTDVAETLVVRKRGRPPGKASAKSGVAKSTKATTVPEEDGVGAKPTAKAVKPAKPLNPHGRPRKYVYIVNEAGKRYRSAAVGEIKMRKGYPACLIYLKKLKKVVVAPNGWKGLGKMPALTPEVIAKAVTFDEFRADPKGDGTGPVATDDDVSDGDEVPQEAPNASEVEAEGPSAKKRKLTAELEEVGQAAPALEAHLAEIPPERLDVVITPAPEATLDSAGDVRKRGQKRKQQEEYQTPAAAKRTKDNDVAATLPAVIPASPSATRVPFNVFPLEPTPATTSTAASSPPALAPLVRTLSQPPDPADVDMRASSPDVTIPGSSTVVEPHDTLRKADKKTSRVSMTYAQKNNELLQCLSDSGGIALKSDLRTLHSDWAIRTAGTPKLYYPQKAVTLDRNTASRIITQLLDRKELLEKKVAVPTSLGTWPIAEVVYLANVSEDRVNDFISRLGHGLGFRAVGIARGAGAKTTMAEPTAFSTASTGRPSVAPKRNRLARQREKELGLTEDDLAVRESISKERYTVAQLYGFVLGRAARARILHEEIVRILGEKPAGLVDVDQGIFVFAMLFEEMTIGAFTSVVAISSLAEELVEFLATPQNKLIRLKDMDQSLRPKRTSYDQKRVMIVMSVLHELGLVSALETAEPEDATIVIDRHDTYGTHFKLAGIPFQPLSQTSVYYKLHQVAPVYHLATTDTPLAGVLPAKTASEAKKFWSDMRQACLSASDFTLEGDLDNPQLSFPTRWPGVTETRTALCNERNWNTAFRPNDTQRAVLSAAIDWAKGTRKVTDSQGLRALCYKSLLPPSVAADYLVRLEHAAKEKLRRHNEGSAPKRRMAHASNSAHAKRRLHDEQLLRQWEKAFKDKADQLGVAWDATLEETLAPHRQAYLLRNTDELPTHEVEQTLLSKISGVIRPQSQPHAVTKPLARIAPRLPAITPASEASPSKPILPPLVPSEVVDLVMEAKVKVAADPARPTRNRHKWTDEELDLLLDAEAVIRSRGRDKPAGARGHGAMTQIFVGWRPPALHNVLKRQRADNPAIAAYYTRLEDAWHSVYLANRGTEALPDGNPESMQDFDLKYHVNFLRRHVNKAALKLDAPAAAVVGQVSHVPREAVIQLPVTVDALCARFDAIMSGVENPINKFWAATSDEGRLNALASAALTTTPIVKTEADHVDRLTGVIDALLKMIISTPEDSYDEATGGRILKPYPSHLYEQEIQKLLEDGVLSRVAGRHSTSRHYGFNATWVTNAAGPYPENVHLDAENLEEKLAGQTDVVWPVIGKDGELAAIMALVSAGVLDMNVDVSSCTALKRAVDDHTTRSITDAETEATITVTPIGLPLSPLLADLPLEPDHEDPNTQKLLDLAQSAGERGLTRAEINLALPEPEPAGLIAASQSPALSWVGYDTARLVHKDHLHHWLVTVYTKDDPNVAITVPPRKWTDIWGEIMEGEWQKAVRLAVGHILSKPGQSERTLRQTLAPFLDRLETNAVLAHLVSNEIAKRAAIDPRQAERLTPVEMTDVAEEELIFWVMDPDTLWRRAQEDTEEL